MMKRWWVIALVFTLALSLTSCSRAKQTQLQADYGFGYCDGSIGSFDVYVIRSQTQPGMYELTVIPVTLQQPGDIVSITVANKSLAYKQMVNQVVINPQQQVFSGYLSDTDLTTYDILAITPYAAGQTFLNAQSDAEALCTLPLPGDGVQ